MKKDLNRLISATLTILTCNYVYFSLGNRFYFGCSMNNYYWFVNCAKDYPILLVRVLTLGLWRPWRKE